MVRARVGVFLVGSASEFWAYVDGVFTARFRLMHRGLTFVEA